MDQPPGATLPSGSGAAREGTPLRQPLSIKSGEPPASVEPQKAPPSVEPEKPLASVRERLREELVPSPSELPRDLRLPEDLTNWLTSILGVLGFQLFSVEAEEPGSFSYTIITNQVERRIVFYIPKEILNDRSKNRDVNHMVYDLRIKKQMIFIVSEDLDVLPIDYEDITERWREDFEVETNFVPWNNLQQIKERNIQYQQDRLPKKFKLSTLPNSPSALHITPVTKATNVVIDRDDLNQIIRIITDFADFKEGVRSRQQLVFQAGLEEVLSNFEYQGNPRTVAGDMVQRLVRYGYIKTMPQGYYALGMLLCYICSLDDVPSSQKEFMKDIVKRYTLVPNGICSNN